MAEKLYRLYCDWCAYSRWTDGTDIQDLVPYKRSAVPTGIPKYDAVTRKFTTKAPINLPKQFKCPKCGRLITPRKYAQEVKSVEENTDAGNQAGNG